MKRESRVEAGETDSFYEKALTRAERLRLSRAKQVRGLDEEIALLRVRLSQLAEVHPEKLELLLKGVRLLIQAVSAKYRLSQEAKDDLSENIAGVLRGVGAALWPEGFSGI